MITRVFVAFLVFLGAVTVAPPAQALLDEIYTEYYDCSVTLVGWHMRECDADTSFGGAQSGYYKRVEKNRCNGTSTTVSWYDCSTGTCTLMSSPPTPPGTC